MATTQSGTVLTCTNPDCPCEVEVRRPCPHGDTYTCACGHVFRAVPSEQRLGDRLEAEGIVDQQAAVLDEIEAEQRAGS
jgi:hypothetical protein